MACHSADSKYISHFIREALVQSGIEGGVVTPPHYPAPHVRSRPARRGVDNTSTFQRATVCARPVSIGMVISMSTPRPHTSVFAAADRSQSARMRSGPAYSLLSPVSCQKGKVDQPRSFWKARSQHKPSPGMPHLPVVGGRDSALTPAVICPHVKRPFVLGAVLSRTMEHGCGLRPEPTMSIMCRANVSPVIST